MRTTRTYSTCDIVIEHSFVTRKTCIYAQDFSYYTRSGDFVLPPEAAASLNAKHIRLFNSMRDFTEWLNDVGAVVDKCEFI